MTESNGTAAVFSEEVDGYLIPKGFSPEKFRDARKYKPRDDDIFIVTFPKCGTNWGKRIVQLLLGKDGAAQGQEADYGLSKTFLEMAGRETVESQPSPRIVTTHVPFEICPWNDKTKYVYIIRNPKDCAVSYYHHTKQTSAYNFADGSFESYLNYFINGKSSFGCYFHHFRSWYTQRNRDNVLFLTYEDMKRDPVTSILKLAKFLNFPNKDLLDPNSEAFQTVLRESGIDAMKNYVNTNYDKALNGADPSNWKAREDYPLDRAPPPPVCFVRKGVVGDWKNLFNVDMSKRIEERMIKETEGLCKITDLWRDEDWREV